MNVPDRELSISATDKKKIILLRHFIFCMTCFHILYMSIYNNSIYKGDPYHTHFLSIYIKLYKKGKKNRMKPFLGKWYHIPSYYLCFIKKYFSFSYLYSISYVQGCVFLKKNKNKNKCEYFFFSFLIDFPFTIYFVC